MQTLPYRRRMLMGLGLLGAVLVSWPLLAQQPKVEPGPTFDEAWETANNQVEFLTAKLEVRAALVQEAEVKVGFAQKQMDATAGAGPAVAAQEKLLAQGQVDLAKAQHRVKVAEMKVIEVQLNQAKRRLGRMKQNPPPMR